MRIGLKPHVGKYWQTLTFTSFSLINQHQDLHFLQLQKLGNRLRLKGTGRNRSWWLVNLWTTTVSGVAWKSVGYNQTHTRIDAGISQSSKNKRCKILSCFYVLPDVENLTFRSLRECVYSDDLEKFMIAICGLACRGAWSFAPGNLNRVHVERLYVLHRPTCFSSRHSGRCQI